MRSSVANISNAALLEENYARWKDDPASVDPAWSAFFEGFELGCAQKPAKPGAQAAGAVPAADTPLQSRVDGLVYAYRTLGHTIAKLDPLGAPRPDNPLLSLRELGFTEKDMDLPVASKFYLGGRRMPLREMLASLQATYADTIGAEFMHIQNARVRNWVRDRIETRATGPGATPDRKISILRHLLEAERFERFLHTKFIGQKRFGLEGAESLMVALETVLGNTRSHGVSEIVMGMAHRGRLNVLSNFLKKPLKATFAQFSENYVPDLVGGDGDVKYHLGCHSVRELPGGWLVGIILSANPSHLEAVDPVVEGRARARQRVLDDMENRTAVLPLLIHGDAAFAGQGIVAEVLNMSQLPGYLTGGTLHVVVNNQIGFTTLPAEARSTFYATDVAKMIEAPVFHVNGDDPPAVAFVAEVALEFRQKFHRDAVIDLWCYRRHGHNEGDEPVYTQPDLYALIDAQPTTATLYRRQLVADGVLDGEQSAQIEQELDAQMGDAFAEVKQAEQEKKKLPAFDGALADFQPAYTHDPADTTIPRALLGEVVAALTTVPGNFNILPKTRRVVIEPRLRAFQNGGPYDWAFAEALAFGSLLAEGTPVRLSGQDCRRGTFSQRHAALFDAKTHEAWIPLNHIRGAQARFCIYNSLLSEAAVLGFDYGYSLGYPEMLCLWEAQFGDFANGAQVITDQFISCAESKWQRLSGLVMLLPHGYEGQGPEHSSARLERFLQLCAEDNIQVANVTTPAQYFHILRRQMKRQFRKPLVIATPKSLLRHPLCISAEADFTRGGFREILPGPPPAHLGETRRAILCSGKVYYDLLAHREANAVADTALLRVEQLYPLDSEALLAALQPFGKLRSVVWCQEEPQNMGAWTFIEPRLRRLLGREIVFAGREAAASAAVGALALHKREQQQLVGEAFRA